MKSKEIIEFKIREHELHINKILALDREEWTDSHIHLIECYLIGRKALQWVLSQDKFINIDEFEKLAKYECLCYDSVNLF